MSKLKNVLAVVVALTILVMPSTAKDRGQGFSGKWVLDKKASKAPQSPEDLREDIHQEGSEVSIQSRYMEPANGITPLLYLGIMAASMRLTTDGQTAQNQIGPFQLASKTTVEGNKMETEWNGVVNGDPVQGHWTRTLSEDGKRMTLDIKESSTKGQGGTATLLFVRK